MFEDKNNNDIFVIVTQVKVKRVLLRIGHIYLSLNGKNLLNQEINTQENLKNVNAEQYSKVYEALLCISIF